MVPKYGSTVSRYHFDVVDPRFDSRWDPGKNENLGTTVTLGFTSLGCLGQYSLCEYSSLRIRRGVGPLQPGGPGGHLGALPRPGGQGATFSCSAWSSSSRVAAESVALPSLWASSSTLDLSINLEQLDLEQQRGYGLPPPPPRAGRKPCTAPARESRCPTHWPQDWGHGALNKAKASPPVVQCASRTPTPYHRLEALRGVPPQKRDMGRSVSLNLTDENIPSVINEYRIIICMFRGGRGIDLIACGVHPRSAVALFLPVDD